MTGATIVLLPFAVIYWWPAAPISLHAWGAVIALGVACTGVAYMLFFHLIAVVGPARAITVTFVIPIFGILWGAVFLGGTRLAGNAPSLRDHSRRAPRLPPASSSGCRASARAAPRHVRSSEIDGDQSWRFSAYAGPMRLRSSHAS